MKKSRLVMEQPGAAEMEHDATTLANLPSVEVSPGAWWGCGRLDWRAGGEILLPCQARAMTASAFNPARACFIY